MRPGTSKQRDNIRLYNTLTCIVLSAHETVIVNDKTSSPVLMAPVEYIAIVDMNSVAFQYENREMKCFASFNNCSCISFQLRNAFLSIYFIT